MNPTKLKKLFWLFLLLIIIIVSIYVLISNLEHKERDSSDEIENNNNYEYNFDETVDLDNISTGLDNNSNFGTDSPDYGVLDEFYDNTDYFFEDRDLYVQTYEGYEVISEEWKNEGFATLIKEPDFGVIRKFIKTPSQIEVRYNEVKMKNVVSYIKELKNLGFTDVIKDEKNNGGDYYIFSAKKEDRTVTLNYEEGSLLIIVF